MGILGMKLWLLSKAICKNTRSFQLRIHSFRRHKPDNAPVITHRHHEEVNHVTGDDASANLEPVA
jgi:hypothetical protein